MKERCAAMALAGAAGNLVLAQPDPRWARADGRSRTLSILSASYNKSGCGGLQPPRIDSATHNDLTTGSALGQIADVFAAPGLSRLRAISGHCRRALPAAKSRSVIRPC